MSHDVIAVYPGTFDPITLGHEDVVRRATELFGNIIVAVAAGNDEKNMFNLEEGMLMVGEAVSIYP
ncbi:MAG: adenylyltransferase/cytidyltransferase family protein, partial [Delftia sp.]|nr:adenylyltransferase/cytidyltransferase family protein [Delftia sp.]